VFHCTIYAANFAVILVLGFVLEGLAWAKNSRSQSW